MLSFIRLAPPSTSFASVFIFFFPLCQYSYFSASMTINNHLKCNFNEYMVPLPSSAIASQQKGKWNKIMQAFLLRFMYICGLLLFFSLLIFPRIIYSILCQCCVHDRQAVAPVARWFSTVNFEKSELWHRKLWVICFRNICLHMNMNG